MADAHPDLGAVFGTHVGAEFDAKPSTPGQVAIGEPLASSLRGVNTFRLGGGHPRGMKLGCA